MTLSTYNHVKISGISAVVPPKEINIYDEIEYYNNSVKKVDRIRAMSGIYKRRVVEDGVTSADLSIQAAQTLFDEMGIDRNQIDALKFVVQRPDYPSPATAYSIHEKLGLNKNCCAFDVNQGCPGWVYGLWISSSLIESGACKKVLLLAGDTPSARVDLSDRVSAPIFGDAGTATLLEYSEDIIKSYFNITVNGKGYEAIITPASGARLPYTRNLEFDKIIYEPILTKSGRVTTLNSVYMDGLAVFNFTMNHVPKSINELLSYCDITKTEITHFMCHQANKQIVQSVAMAINYPIEKTPFHTFETYGNSSIASIPVSINDNLKENIENGLKETVLCSGFGNGLACASTIQELKNIYLSGVRNFKKPANHPNRYDIIKYWQEKIKNSEA